MFHHLALPEYYDAYERTCVTRRTLLLEYYRRCAERHGSRPIEDFVPETPTEGWDLMAFLEHELLFPNCLRRGEHTRHYPHPPSPNTVGINDADSEDEN